LQIIIQYNAKSGVESLPFKTAGRFSTVLKISNRTHEPYGGSLTAVLSFFVLGTLKFHEALGSTQPVTEMSTRNISCGVTAAGA
jgi:hypothetical protein